MTLNRMKLGIAGVMAVLAAVLTFTVCTVLARHDLAHNIFTNIQAAFNHAVTDHLTARSLAGLSMLFTLVGATTVIQTWPIAGTFPTSAQAVNFNTQISRVIMADADTTATLTHNWGISAAQLAAFFPLINYYAQNVGTNGTTLAQLTFALTDSNTVTITKTAATGSAGTFVVEMQRPYSATQ